MSTLVAALVERETVRDGPLEGNPAAVEAIEKRIAPLVLPASLKRLWQAVPVGAIGFGDIRDESGWLSYLDDPALSFWVWTASRDRPGLMPEALMAVSSTGPHRRFVELELDGVGGAVYECSRHDPVLRKRFRSVDAWLAALTRVVRDPAARTLGFEPPYWVDVDPDRLAREVEAELDDAAPIARNDPAAWPERWRSASGLFEGRRAGSEETSVGTWLASEASAGTVAGLIRNVDHADAGGRILLLDGTGVLDVWCPPSVTGSWLTDMKDRSRMGPFFAFEFDVRRARAADGNPSAGDSPPPARPEAIVERLRLRPFG